VLAGGAGTRLRACVADRPKPLADVAGRPFLERVLDQLVAAGVTRAILCTGYRGEMIERAYGLVYRGLELVWSREGAPLDTGGALAAALPFVPSDDVLVLNGDSYCGVDLAAFTDFARRSGGVAALVAVEVQGGGRYGRVHVDADARVCAFREKSDTGPGLVNAGVYWLRRDELARLDPRGPLSLERDVLPELLARGVYALRTRAPFLDIGTPESYARAPEFFAKIARRAGLLVLDRDGTIIEERGYLADPAGVALLPGAAEGLRRFATFGYELAVVTNQSGIGRGYFGESDLRAVHDELRAQLAGHGVELAGIWHCPHHPEVGCACRKPAPALLRQALTWLGYRPEQCLVVGDKECDIELGRGAGARTALVRTGYGRDTERGGRCAPDLVADDLGALAEHAVPEARA
jgi:histidinol-phosphate phosphatase family protein